MIFKKISKQPTQYKRLLIILSFLYTISYSTPAKAEVGFFQALIGNIVLSAIAAQNPKPAGVFFAVGPWLSTDDSLLLAESALLGIYDFTVVQDPDSKLDPFGEDEEDEKEESDSDNTKISKNDIFWNNFAGLATIYFTDILVDGGLTASISKNQEGLQIAMNYRF